MAERGWGGSIATASCAAAGAGAAQLGLGYGLEIIAWLPSTDSAGDAAWVTSLAWTAWISATSTVFGAISAGRHGDLDPAVPAPDVEGDRPAPLAVHVRRVVLSLAAAVGALVTVALVAVPARTVTGVDATSPPAVAAGYALLGLVLGLVVAFWALSSRAVAINVIATVSWLWLLAVIAAVDPVIRGRGPAGAQLGVWRPTSNAEAFWFRDYLYWPGAALSLGSALLIGVLVARRWARRPETRVGAAASGMAGPLLVAGAYLLAAPRLADTDAEQLSAHLLAPYAAIAGLAGSVMVAALAQRAETRARLISDVPVRSGEAASPGGTTEAAVAPTQPIGGPDDNSGSDDLADQAYAPARTYSSNDARRVDAGAEKRPTVASPAWPEETGVEHETKKKARRLGRRHR